MKTKLKDISEYLILFIIGGLCYFLIEILWRGYSHWTMFLLGGVCFIVIGLINQFYLTWNMNICYQMSISSLVITVLEFLVGYIVNIQLGWNVWDYSHLPLNILGQVCVPYMILWLLLSLPAILVDDWIRHILFKEERPHYYLYKPSRQQS